MPVKQKHPAKIRRAKTQLIMRKKLIGQMYIFKNRKIIGKKLIK